MAVKAETAGRDAHRYRYTREAESFVPPSFDRRSKSTPSFLCVLPSPRRPLRSIPCLRSSQRSLIRRSGESSEIEKDQRGLAVNSFLPGGHRRALGGRHKASIPLENPLDVSSASFLPLRALCVPKIGSNPRSRASCLRRDPPVFVIY